MKSSCRLLVFGWIVLASACGSAHQPMTRARQPPAEAFLGPIPTDFRNAVARDALPAALAASNLELQGLLAKLAAKPAAERRRPQSPTNGLPEIASCTELNKIAGGLLPRDALTTPRLPVAADELAGLSCLGVLTKLGSGVPPLAAALVHQFESLTALAPASDDCTHTVESTRPTPRAAVSYVLSKVKEGPNLYLNQFATPFLTGIVEGGAVDGRLALRAELDVEAEARDAWGTRRSLGQKAAVASWLDPAAATLEGHRVEYLDVATRAVDGQKAAGRLWLSTEARFQLGDEIAFVDETDWTFIANGIAQQSDRLVIKASQLGSDGLKLDVQSQFPQKEQSFQLTCRFDD